MCSVRSILFAALCIPLGITGADDEASSLAHCVNDSRIRGSLDRVEPDWVHETARCIGPHRTQGHCVNDPRNRGSPDRVESDWMHETARCFGYPSDSTRAAREPGVGQLAGTIFTGPGQCGRPGPPSPRFVPSPLWLKPASRPCGSTLAGVGRRPLAIGPRVSSRAAYRRARSPARIATVVLAGCSGAGSGWCCRAWIAVCTVSLGGSATVGAGPLLCADSWAVTVWRIASAARLRQPRGHRAERGHPVTPQHGTTVAALSASSAFGAGRPG